MDVDLLREHQLTPSADGAEVWYCRQTPAWALAELLSDDRLLMARPVMRNEAEVAAELARHHGPATAAQVIGAASVGDDLAALLQESATPSHIDGLDDDAPVVRMVNAIFQEAAARGASDIHLEPYENTSVVRFRLDGLLRTIAQPPRLLHAAIISRIKIMASMDIAEKRLPQDGRISVRVSSGVLDVRVSTLPTGQGERAVLRLLEKRQEMRTLESLGMADDTLNDLCQIIRRPHGILLVTGPTGSGKTTTLYAALARINVAGLNIMTVEDPIEYEVPGVSQTQVHPKIGLGFAHVLRSVLRQDPDVILIGEIRDVETAQIAIQAALTGHLVLATLHTNDAPSAVTRLLDMGIEPYLLSSSLAGILAQRLVRRGCGACHSSGVHDGMACAVCDGSGYSGRLGIFEMLTVDGAIQESIRAGLDANGIRRTALSRGFRDLRTDGERLVAKGVTTRAELERVTALGVDVLDQDGA